MCGVKVRMLQTEPFPAKLALMSITVEGVLQDALCLTEDSRILLAERLLESVPPDKAILDHQVAVAVGRAHELESGAVKGIPGTEALKRVRESIENRLAS